MHRFRIFLKLPLSVTPIRIIPVIKRREHILLKLKIKKLLRKIRSKNLASCTHDRIHTGSPNIHIPRVNLVEFPLMTVSVYKCPPSLLDRVDPGFSFYFHVSNCLDCSTGSFNVSKPTKLYYLRITSRSSISSRANNIYKYKSLYYTQVIQT